MSETKTLQVMYDEKLVGTLAMASGHKVAFQYSEEWLEDGFSISPFSLPLKNQDDKLFVIGYMGRNYFGRRNAALLGKKTIRKITKDKYLGIVRGTASRSANAISGSIIQNSAACLVVLESSALKVGPNV